MIQSFPGKSGTWTHEKFKDVFVNILRVQYRGPKYTKVRVEWWNKNGMPTRYAGLIKPYPIGITETIKIRTEDYQYWTPYKGKNGS